MSLLGNIVWNFLERVTSGDLNDAQSYLAGQLLQGARFVASQSALLGGPGGPADTRSVVGGFDLTTPGAADQLTMDEGTIAQYAPALAPAPGTFDSPYRLATSSPLTLPLPTPAAPTWYVLEARWVRLPVTLQVRDIYTVGPNIFIPGVVPKIETNSVEFQLVAGTPGGPIPSPSLPATGWVPLYAIFRPAGSSIFDPLTQAWDLRCSPADAGGRGYNEPFRQVVADCYCDGTTLTIDRCDVPGRLFGRDIEVPPQSFAPASILQVGGIILPSTTYYVYAYLWNGLPTRRQTPPGLIANSNDGNVQLVLSALVPVQAPGGAWVAPGFGIQPPGDWQNAAVASNGILVCSIRRDATNTRWIGMRQVGKHVYTSDADYLTTYTNPAGLMSVAPAFPAHAKTLDVRILWDNDDAGGPAQARTVVTSMFGSYLNVIDIGRVPGFANSRGTALFTATDAPSVNFSAPVYLFGAGGNNGWAFEPLGYSW